MKKAATFILCLLCLPMMLYGRNVTVRAVDQPAATVFRSIVGQTGKNFVYPSELLHDMRISVTMTDAPLEKVLEAIFAGTDIEFHIKGRNIILKRRRKATKAAKKPLATTHKPPTPLSVGAMSGTLEEVTVVSRLEAPVTETPMIGAKKLTAQEIISTPALFGESDVIKSLQMQPGISEGNEALAGMHVHGGNADENLYMLDNVPLYQVNHFAGLFSAFNAEAIRYVDFFKSSIPARYDGRLSSFLDVRTRNGSADGHHGSFRLGLTSGSLNISGPIASKTTYSAAMRRSWLDLLTIPFLALGNAASDTEKIRFRYAFTDLNAKVTHRFTDKATAFVSVYFGNDVLKTGYTDTPQSADGWYDDDKSDFHWGNLVAQTGFDYRFAPALSAEFTAAYTRYFSAMKHHCLSKETIAGNTTETTSDTRIDNNINDWIFRGDFDWRASDNSHLRFGGGYTLHTFLPARSESRHITAATQIQAKDSTWAYTAHEANLYIEDDWRISPTLHANLGLHMSLFAIDGHTHTGLGPRASISFNPRHDWALKAAYARTNQYVHQLAQTYLSLPTDQWVPVTAPFRPQTADKVSIGAYWQPANSAYAISVEAYYKSMRNLVDYRDEYYLLPPAAMWHAQLCAGKGTAKGIDITIGKQLGRLTGHISYSLAWADRTFPDKNNGRTFPARFDNRHTINIAASLKISDKVTLNAAWTGHSGNRFTLLPQMWESPGFGAGYYADEIPLKTGTNNYQLPFYHRLDLSCEVRNRRGYFTLGLFNAYCHMNTVAIRRAYDRGGRPVFQKVKLLPVIPSVSYTWQF